MIRKPEPRVSLLQPCPCGSGRKYRRCCWPREKQEYASALGAIRDVTGIAIRYVEDRFPHLIESAENEFFGRAEDALDEDELRPLVDEHAQMLIPNMLDAMLADERGPGGRPALELFLEDDASAALHPAAREFAAAWAAAPVSLYEVDEINPGEGMVLKDLLRRRRLEVVEKAATESLRQWDVLFTRVAEMDGINLLTGSLYPLLRRDLPWLLEQLHRLKGRPGSRSLSWTSFLKRDWSLVSELWFHLHAPSARFPRLVNTDGEPLLMVDLSIEVLDRDELSRRLDETSGMEAEEPDTWSLGEDRRAGRLALAFLSLEGDTLRVSVNSLERESRVVALLRDRAADCLGAVRRQETPVDWDSLGDEHPPVEDPSEPSVPLEIEYEVVHQVLEKHYRSWPDIGLPALDGCSPREAARDPALRPRLVSLLKDMELSQSRASGPMATFDLSFLWDELGLRRP